MPTLDIRPVSSSKELEQFVRLPFALHQHHPQWVPPIITQDLELLDTTRHPFWEQAQGQLFLAWQQQRPVGRIAAMVDHKYNDFAREQCGSFGFYECEDNDTTAQALLDAARHWLVTQGMTHMRGPLNPSANYTCGMLVHGFEETPAVMMPWNPPYYPAQLENWGMRKDEDLFAYVIRKDQLNISPKLQQEVARIKAEGRFTCRHTKKATLADDIRIMLELYRLSWADNWGFSPLSPAEADRHVHELKNVIDPEFFVLFFHGERPVAGMVALPDLNPLLKRLNGSLGITAPWHYLLSRKQVAQGLRIMLFGILPEYRLQGLPLLLLDYMVDKAMQKPGLQWVEGSWILERNFAMNELLEDFSGLIAKRYRIYGHRIGPC